MAMNLVTMERCASQKLIKLIKLKSAVDDDVLPILGLDAAVEVRIDIEESEVFGSFARRIRLSLSRVCPRSAKVESTRKAIATRIDRISPCRVCSVHHK